MSYIIGAVRSLWGLLVDDGAVAFGGLAAVGVGWLLSESVGASLTVGVAVFMVAWIGMAVSLRLAVSRALAQPDHGELPPLVPAEADRREARAG